MSLRDEERLGDRSLLICNVCCKTHYAILRSNLSKACELKTDVILRPYREHSMIFMYSIKIRESLSLARVLDLPFNYFNFQLKSFHQNDWYNLPQSLTKSNTLRYVHYAIYFSLPCLAKVNCFWDTSSCRVGKEKAN